MIKEFSSRGEMLRYEHEREQYYLDSISSTWKIYKTMFLSIFHPRHRAIRREYDGYEGGFWRDEHGWLCANHIALIDIGKLKDGDICAERDDDAIFGLYVFRDGYLCKLNLE